MNTLESNQYTRTWEALGKNLPRPRAILCISAHWFIGSTVVTAMPDPRTIHDFYGFPQALFDYEYPASGAPDLAKRIAELIKPDWIGLDQDQWGLDHGTWSILAHMFPEADIPVVQLSINAMKPFDYHVRIGRALAPLRDEGVLILGSGNVVHILRLIQWRRPEYGEDWAVDFDQAVVDQMAADPGKLWQVVSHPGFSRAVPTPDHFLPLAYIAGVATEGEGTAKAFLQSYTMGSLSITRFQVGDGPRVNQT